MNNRNKHPPTEWASSRGIRGEDGLTTAPVRLVLQLEYGVRVVHGTNQLCDVAEVRKG